MGAEDSVGDYDHTMHKDEVSDPPRLARHEEGLRGRVGMYVATSMEALGLAEREHNSRNNRMRTL